MILSKSTNQISFSCKLLVYLILSQQEIQIDVYRAARNWARERFQGLDTVVELEKPMLRLPLRAIYDKVLALGLLGFNEEP